MKAFLSICAILAAVAACAAAGFRLFSRRSTEATLSLEAKPAGRIAIVYWSESKVGNTATAAQWLAKHTGGELVPIETVVAYPKAYGDILKAAKEEMKSGWTRPINPVTSLDEYDLVFLGTPIWYGTFAPPVSAFIETGALKGKRVAPFCTHGGGGAGKYFTDLRKVCPDSQILQGLSLRGSNQIERRLGTGISSHHTEDDVVEYLNKLLH